MGIKAAWKALLGTEQKSADVQVLEQRSGEITGMPVNYSQFYSLFNTWWSGGANKSKVNVTPETSLSLSALYSSVRNISEDISKLDFKILLYKTDGNAYPLYKHPARLLLDVSPNQFSTPFALKETLLKSAILRGNGYAYIERDPISADPIAMYWLRDECVNPILSGRKMFYNVNDTQLQINGTFKSDDIFHLRGFGDGYIGKSVVTIARESIGKAIATQEYGASFFGSTGLKGILKFLNLKDETKLKQHKADFQRTYEEDGLAAIASGGMEFEKIQITNNEAQFIESQDFNVSDIARWFRMPLFKLQKDTTAGTEAQEIAYVNDCLMPWIVRLNQEIETKLLRESEKTSCVAHFDTDMLLKGDTAAQERRIKTKFMTGAMSPNEVRKFFGENTVNLPHMNEYMFPVNMIPGSQLEAFWEGKQANQNTLEEGSPDSSGSGNVNANINDRSEQLAKLIEVSEIIERYNLLNA